MLQLSVETSLESRDEEVTEKTREKRDKVDNIFVETGRTEYIYIQYSILITFIGKD